MKPKAAIIGAGIAAIASAFAPAATIQIVETGGQSQNTRQTRDQRTIQIKAPEQQVVTRKLPSFMGFTNGPVPYRMLNQRQYRKMCRQNPSMYRSKKHRSKN